MICSELLSAERQGFKPTYEDQKQTRENYRCNYSSWNSLNEFPNSCRVFLRYCFWDLMKPENHICLVLTPFFISTATILFVKSLIFNCKTIWLIRLNLVNILILTGLIQRGKSSEHSISNVLIPFDTQFVKICLLYKLR